MHILRDISRVKLDSLSLSFKNLLIAILGALATPVSCRCESINIDRFAPKIDWLRTIETNGRVGHPKISDVTDSTMIVTLSVTDADTYTFSSSILSVNLGYVQVSECSIPNRNVLYAVGDNEIGYRTVGDSMGYVTTLFVGPQNCDVVSSNIFDIGVINSCRKTLDENYLATGNSRIENPINGLVYKFSGAMDTVWTTSINNGLWTYSTFNASCDLDDRSIAVVGYTTVISPRSENMLVARLTSNGEPQWQYVSESNTNDRLDDCEKVGPNRILAVGTSCAVDPFECDLLTVQFDTAGSLLEYRRLNDNTTIAGASIVTSLENNVLLVASNLIDKLSQNSRCLLWAVNANGEPLFSSFIQYDFPFIVTDIHRGEENTVYLVGSKEFPAIDGRDEVILARIRLNASVFNDNGYRSSAQSLKSVSPNPFSNIAVVTYFLKEPSQVDIGLYNLLGQQVLQITRSFEYPGYSSVAFSAHGLPAGVYFVRLNASGTVNVLKVILLN